MKEILTCARITLEEGEKCVEEAGYQRGRDVLVTQTISQPALIGFLLSHSQQTVPGPSVCSSCKRPRPRSHRTPRFSPKTRRKTGSMLLAVEVFTQQASKIKGFSRKSASTSCVNCAYSFVHTDNPDSDIKRTRQGRCVVLRSLDVSKWLPLRPFATKFSSAHTKNWASKGNPRLKCRTT